MGEMVDRDVEHLQLLKLCYFILAGFTSLFTLFALLYIGIGGLLSFNLIASNPRSNEDRMAGLIFLGIGIAFLVFSLAVGLANYWTGRCLRDRRQRVFCLLSAALSLLNMPFGTAIGVCTFIVLNRPSVRALFEAGPAAASGLQLSPTDEAAKTPG